MARKKTKEEFIAEIDDIYNNTIDLSSFDFVDCQTKGLCKCKVCGSEWYARPYSLTAGHGCRKCYDKHNSQRRTQPLSEVQERIHQVSPNIDIVGHYINTKYNVLCRCRICNTEWMALPSDLFRGHGCPTCNRVKTPNEVFIKQCKEKYGDKYDLSQVQLVTLLDNITVICRKHGPFTIKAKSFLHRKTEVCPKCIEEAKKVALAAKEEKKCNLIPPKPKVKRKTKEERRQEYIEQFVPKLEQVFEGRNYDFSKVVYVDCQTKVDVICPEHGLFSAIPYSLLSGHGCPICGNKGFYYKTGEDWVRRAKKVHPNFNYDKTNYINNKTTVIVTCPVHGDIKVYPKDFMKSKEPCSQCRTDKRRKKNSDKLWRRIEKVYEGRDYTIMTSEDTIINTSDNIDVRCNKHDHVFHPNVSNILCVKCGCPKCANEEIGAKSRLTLEEILERIHKVHGDRYDTSLITEAPKNVETKVTVICPEHGPFRMRLHGLMAGRGCPKCRNIAVGLKIRLTHEEFMERISKIHLGKNYDFSKVQYTRQCDRVEVFCNNTDRFGNIHGIFRPKAGQLLVGQGCPKCNSSILEQTVRRALILDGIEYEEQKRFTKWLGRKSLDFYIPSKQIAIECQGSQHFTDKHEGYFKSDLEAIQERDRQKASLLKEHNIRLLYFTEEWLMKYIPEGDDGIYFTSPAALIHFIQNF